MAAKERVIKHYEIVVKGKVQGVFFRLSTKAIADQLGVKGIAMNMEDGSVLIEAEGDDFALDSMLEWCHEGPERSEVEAVASVEKPLKHYQNFEVVKSRR